VQDDEYRGGDLRWELGDEPLKRLDPARGGADDDEVALDDRIFGGRRLRRVGQDPSPLSRS
jgi:hypothetical protein